MVAIEGYEIFAELQRSPWVKVFKAFDQQRQQMVIVKALMDEAAPTRVREQLLAESSLSQRLSHPNLRRVYEAGMRDGRPYLILEYVEGGALAEVIGPSGRGGLPFEMCVWITKEVARALQALHDQGILHRDIKPGNIFWSVAGEIKLGDLGLAVELDDAQQNLAGTIMYFPPEIILGQTATEASDLFSLGAVLYEMLTGEPPFIDHTTSAMLHRIANFEPTPVEKLRPQIPPELATLSRQLLAKEPEQRLARATELLERLDHFERQYELRMTAQRAASFFAQPEAYQAVKFESPSAAPPPVVAALPAALKKPIKLHRRFSRFAPASAVIFAVISIILLNIQFDHAASSPEVTPVSEESPQIVEVEQPAFAPSQTLAAKTQVEPLKSHQANVSMSPADSSAATGDAMSQEVIVPVGDFESSRIEANRSILIVSEPRANVFVEQDSLGATPLLWQPASSLHVSELNFSVPNFPPVRRSVVTAALESDTLYVNLYEEVGFLEIAVNPWGEIWINGKAFDTTPLAAPIALAPGLHEVSVRHPRLGIQTQRVVVAKGDTLQKFFDLFLP